MTPPSLQSRSFYSVFLFPAGTPKEFILWEKGFPLIRLGHKMHRESSAVLQGGF